MPAINVFPRDNLSAAVYDRIKAEIFDFRLLPGDRFTESEVAQRVGVSRTPVREALYRLEREGYISVSPRNGWSVKPFDFASFEDLYDVRVILELAALERLATPSAHAQLEDLCATWLVPPEARERDAAAMCELDEAFHRALVIAAGNPELARIHRDIAERIRIIRRLDFSQDERIDATYDEHAGILGCVKAGRLDEARSLLKRHINASKAVVRQITLHRLHSARAALSTDVPEQRRTA